MTVTINLMELKEWATQNVGFLWACYAAIGFIVLIMSSRRMYRTRYMDVVLSLLGGLMFGMFWPLIIFYPVFRILSFIVTYKNKSRD